MSQCEFPVGPDKTCPDRAEWLIGTTSPVEGGQMPMCGMHAMRFKEPDGFTRTQMDSRRDTA